MKKARSMVAGALALAFSSASVLAVTIDFETDEFGSPLGNGKKLANEFATNFFTITSAGPGHLGPAIFDSSNPGPNAGGGDPDLLVGLGNIAIMQNENFPAESPPGFFQTPNDEASFNGGRGEMIFNFNFGVELTSIDMVDINGGGNVRLTLEDSAFLTRTYVVPDDWTGDITVTGPPGFQTLDLTTLANQPGIGPGNPNATVSQDAGFTPTDVQRLVVSFDGSAGIDNLVFVPEPSALLVLGLGGVVLIRRKRR